MRQSNEDSEPRPQPGTDQIRRGGTRRPAATVTGSIFPRRLVRFGVFEADLESGELRKSGSRIRLQDQPFLILEALVEQPGAVVSRAALHARLWPAGTFVDTEHGLNAAVKRLRTALGDPADTPRFVETLHRRGYRFIAPVETVGSNGVCATPPTATSPDRIRVAVLPFVNLSADADQEYFSDGLTEEMIARLGRAHPERLGVIARTSAARFKRSGRPVDEIGRELGVAFVVEGSVRQSAGRVRIMAQLVDARDQTHLWSDTYDGELADWLAVQAEVASRIARALAVELLPGTSESIAACCTPDVVAYRAYLKGRFHWNTQSAAGCRRAVAHYTRALEVDPGFARAHAALARATLRLVESGESPAEPALGEARERAELALRLDPSMSWAHLALASIRAWTAWDWTGAESHYRQALRLSPHCEAGHYLYGRFLAALDRRDEARAHSARACEIDPLCLVVNSNDAWIHYVARRYDEALEVATHVLDLDVDFAPAHSLVAAASLEVGRADEAIDHFQRVVALEGRRPAPLTRLAHGLASVGRGDEARALLRELTATRSAGSVCPYHLALVQTALGATDAAFAALDAARDQRAVDLVHLVVDPRLDPLRRDARFERLLSRLGLARFAPSR